MKAAPQPFVPPQAKSTRGEKLSERTRFLAANFDHLADEQYVDGRTVDAVLCISRATRHRFIKAKKLTVYRLFEGGNQRLKVGEVRMLQEVLRDNSGRA